MKTSSKTLFLTMMIISTLMVVSSSSWINMWIGMEINLMSFIPMVSTSKNIFLSQSTMSYFLIQSMASMLFITIIITNKYIFTNLNKEIIMMTITITMMMKMGMPPFHMWFPEIMNKMNWIMCFLLMTWQKIAPMFVMSMTIKMNNILMLIIALSAITGAIGGMNQTSTRKIMAYSSINHMSWMITCAAMFKKSWMTYMMLYIMITLIMSMMLHKYNINFINQMNIFFDKNMNKIIIIVMMLSIGGIPPFLGFLPKWITIQYMIENSEYLIMLIMMMSSLITLAYYLRMTSSMNLSLSHSQKWMNNPQTSKIIPTGILLINLALPMMVLTMNLF